MNCLSCSILNIWYSKSIVNEILDLKIEIRYL